MKTAKYCMTLRETKNNRTGKTFYYIERCGNFERVSKTEYWKKYDESDGVSCLHGFTKGDLSTSFRTLVFYH